jgi:RNA polymerase sigma-70 factor, ECF subfamily
MDNEQRVQYEWLALRCQAGEASAFDDLIAVMERPLLYYAMTLTGSEDGALDVLQEAWLRAFRSIHKLRDPGTLRPWLYSIAHGIAIDHIRRNVAREKAESTHLEDFEEAEEPSFADHDTAAIHAALAQIGVQHREVLILHFLNDLSLSEIATVVGCSEGTVKSRIHYAKRAMKEILKGASHGTTK